LKENGIVKFSEEKFHYYYVLKENEVWKFQYYSIQYI